MAKRYAPKHKYMRGNVSVYSEIELTDDEVDRYLKMGKSRLHGNLHAVEIAEDEDPDFVKIDFVPIISIPTERVQRVTHQGD